jgi:oligopeptidase A
VRHEIAQLVGFSNFAEYSLATKMAKTPSTVLQFLHDLITRSKPVAQQEWRDVTALAKQLDNIADLAAWDLPYYAEKLREKTFHFTQEDLRPYFPIQTVLDGMFTIVQQLFGLTIREEFGIDAWHASVKFFVIHDKTHTLRGGFYTDLYARLHKREGAWMDDCRTRRRLSNQAMQLPIAFLTCNFMPPIDDQPALLNHDEVLTLFHEFGHCLHHLLTTVERTAVAGIHGVPWDAVEFPSQFLENWCWEKEAIPLISSHYQSGHALPDDLYHKMVSAKHFQAGLQMLRQLELALFDFRLHLEYADDQPNRIQTLLTDIRSETSIYAVPSYNRFQHGFSHIFAGGYAAGYYSYKWAEVLSADAFAHFIEHGIFDLAAGESFMKNILETGGVRDPMISFITFRGREPTINALLQQNGISTHRLAT